MIYYKSRGSRERGILPPISPAEFHFIRIWNVAVTFFTTLNNRATASFGIITMKMSSSTEAQVGTFFTSLFFSGGLRPKNKLFDSYIYKLSTALTNSK